MECRKREATSVDVLAFEFELGLFPAVLDDSKQKGIAVLGQRHHDVGAGECWLDSSTTQLICAA